MGKKSSNNLTPHGPGFQFIDSCEIIEEGKKVRAVKWLDPEMPFFEDHFPDEPLMPGVFLIEAAAQTSGGIWKSSDPYSKKPLRYVLAQVESFRIRRAVFPEQTIQIESSLMRDFGSLAKFEVVIIENDQVVAEGEIVLSQKVIKD